MSSQEVNAQQGGDVEPRYSDICEIANQIAALKSRLCELEKVIDAALAQHLSCRADDSTVLASGDPTDPDAPLESLPQVTDPDVVSSESAPPNEEPVMDWTLSAIETGSGPADDIAPATDAGITLPSEPDDAFVQGVEPEFASPSVGDGDNGQTPVSGLYEEDGDEFAALPDADQCVVNGCWIEEAAISSEVENSIDACPTQEHVAPAMDAASATADTAEILVETTAASNDADEDSTANVAEGLLAEQLFDDPADTALSASPSSFTSNNIAPYRCGFYPDPVRRAFGPQSMRIMHHAPVPARDWGHYRSLAASLAATAIIAASALMSHGAPALTVLPQGTTQSICETTGLSMIPDVCHQILSAAF